MESVKKFLDEIDKVYDCNWAKARYGNKHDGGYIILPELCREVKEVYSFGIGDDVGFEMEFLNNFPNTNIKLFDPTIDVLPENRKNFEFNKCSVVSGYDKIKNASNNSLLKMDIEWCEWESFWLLSDEILNKFSQIIVELHIVHAEPKKELSPYFNSFYQNVFNKINEELFESYYQILKKLNNLFYIFHIHPNNSLPKIEVGGYKFPPLIELSFVRKDLAGVVKNTVSIFPVKELDFPNKPLRKDIENFYPMGVKHIRV